MDAFIQCYWTLDASPEITASRQRIIPDGCMELIFHYGDLYRQYHEDGSSRLQPRCFIYGQITTSLEIEASGVTGIFAARFYPAGLLPFIRVPVKQLENKATPLAEVFGQEAAQLEQNILQAGTTDDRIRICSDFLMQCLRGQQAADQAIASFLAIIWQMRGQGSVQEYAEELKLSRRQLERKCAQAIGLSPKQLARVARMQHTLMVLREKQFNRLTDVAYDLDYYDQAHFIRDFREFTGLSPRQFFGERLKLSSLFHS